MTWVQGPEPTQLQRCCARRPCRCHAAAGWPHAEVMSAMIHPIIWRKIHMELVVYLPTPKGWFCISYKWVIIPLTIDLSPININKPYVVGGFNLPLWKKMEWVRQLGWWYSQLNGKIKTVPNYQPAIIYPSFIYLYPLSHHFYTDIAVRTKQKR